MEELLQAINNHAEPRVYDWIMFGATLIGVFVAIAVAVFTYKIYSRQLKLMEEQKVISDTQTRISEKQTEIMEQQKNITTKQTNISERQTEIMEQQNMIALFDKRYELFDKIHTKILSMTAFDFMVDRHENGREISPESMKSALYHTSKISSNFELHKESEMQTILYYLQYKEQSEILNFDEFIRKQKYDEVCNYNENFFNIAVQTWLDERDIAHKLLLLFNSEIQDEYSKLFSAFRSIVIRIEFGDIDIEQLKKFIDLRNQFESKTMKTMINITNYNKTYL